MQMSEYLQFIAGGSVYGSLNGLLSTRLRKDLCLSDGITALSVQLIPGRRFRGRQTTVRGNLVRWGLGSCWPKQKAPPRMRQM